MHAKKGCRKGTEKHAKRLHSGEPLGLLGGPMGSLWAAFGGTVGRNLETWEPPCSTECADRADVWMWLIFYCWLYEDFKYIN